MGRQGHRTLRSDGAMSDLVGTLLMVAAVVAMGSVLAIVVAQHLTQPAPAAASFALSPVSPGDSEVSVLLRQGAPLPLRDLRVGVVQGEKGEMPVARDQWSTPDPEHLRPGDRLRITLATPVAANERLLVRLYDSAANHLVGEVSARSGTSSAALAPANLTLRLQPSTLPNDGTTTGVLTARVSHPLGALAATGVVADITALQGGTGVSGTLALRDDGTNGDRVGGDGIWTAPIRVSTRATPGTYTIPVRVTDLTGAVSAQAATQVTVTTSTLENALCIGCAIPNGERAQEGTRLRAPASSDIQSLVLTNWTWDNLHPERLDKDATVVRILGGGKTWSAYITFGFTTDKTVPNHPHIKQMRIWNDLNETVYRPRNSTFMPLANASIDLLNPVASEQWAVVSGSPDPHATYRYANITQKPVFIVAFLRDEQATANTPESQDTGIYSVDAEFR